MKTKAQNYKHYPFKKKLPKNKVYYNTITGGLSSLIFIWCIFAWWLNLMLKENTKL